MKFVLRFLAVGMVIVAISDTLPAASGANEEIQESIRRLNDQFECLRDCGREQNSCSRKMGRNYFRCVDNCDRASNWLHRIWRDCFDYESVTSCQNDCFNNWGNLNSGCERGYSDCQLACRE